MKRNNRKTFHLSAKLIASDSDIDEACKHYDKNKKLRNYFIQAKSFFLQNICSNC